MGKLGLGVPEAVLAGSKNTVLPRLHCSPAKLIDVAFANASGTAFRVSFESLLGPSLRIPVGIPLSWMYSCWFGLLPGEFSPKPGLEPGL